MHKHGFLHIVEVLGQHNEYFRTRVDATGRWSISPLHKCIIVISMMAYGTSTESVDDYLRIDETMTLKYVNKFTRGIISIVGAQYLWRLNTEDTESLMQIREALGFPSMIWSIDYMDWIWKIYLVALKGGTFEAIMGNQLLCLKQLFHNTYEFGMHSLW